MRRYRIYYYAEYKDECHDFEENIEAENLEDAISKFKEEFRVFKRIYKIEELPNQFLV